MRTYCLFCTYTCVAHRWDDELEKYVLVFRCIHCGHKYTRPQE